MNISGDVYDQLIADPACSLKWFCDSFDTVVSNMDLNSIVTAVVRSVSSTVDKLTDTMQRMEQNFVARVSVLEQKIDSKAEMDEVKAIRDMLHATPDIVGAVDGVGKLVKGMETNMLGVMSTLEQKVSVKADQDEVKKISETIQSAPDVRGCIEGALKTQLAEDKHEEWEIEQRKTSVIIHGIAESTMDTLDERIETDLLQVAGMLQELDLNDVKVEKVIRLGKKAPSGEKDTKPRPLKVIVDNEDNKWRIVRNAKNLRDSKDGGWERVFVHQDLTPRQREARNKLVQQLKTRVAQGEKDLIIYRGAVVKKRRT